MPFISTAAYRESSSAQFIEEMRNTPHWCRYLFRDPRDTMAYGLKYFANDDNRWLGTIEYGNGEAKVVRP